MDNDNDVIVRVARASAAAATAASHADWTSIRRTSTSRIEAVRFIVRSTSSLEGERGGEERVRSRAPRIIPAEERISSTRET